MTAVYIHPKGTSAARYIACLHMAEGDVMRALPIAEKRAASTPIVAHSFKMAVSDPLGTGGSALTPSAAISSEFVELERGASVIGALIEFFRRVPFLQPTPREVAGASASWVGQGRPIPVSEMAFDSVAGLDPTKASAIIVITKALARLWTAASEAAIIGSIKAGLGSFIDRQFFDPAIAEVADGSGVGTILSPASITNGATEIMATGNTAAQKLADLSAMAAALLAWGHPVWIMHPRTAISLAATLNTAGQMQFPGMSLTGGSLLGIPVLVTPNMPSPAGTPANKYIVLLDAGAVLFADDGAVEVDTSEQASLQMLTDPITGAAAQVSLFQSNLVGIRVQRTQNWVRARADSVIYMHVSY